MSDLISRQAAIDALQNLAYNDWNKGVSTSWGDAFTECAEIIRDLPSAQSEQKKGRWEMDVLDGTPGYRPVCIVCSECHVISFARFSYCPNCGAKMEVEHEHSN